MRPEERLILLCARTHVEPRQIEQIRSLIEQSLRWDDLVDIATFHRVLPLVYGTLKNNCPELVPHTILEGMRDYFRENLYNTLFLKSELRELLGLFRSHEVLVVPYKGVALSIVAYNDLPLRVTTDIDLVVRECDIPRATELLLAQGYHRLKDEVCRRTREATYRRYFYHDVFVHLEKHLSVELHWRFMRDPHILSTNDEYFWQNLQPLEIAGMTATGFSPEDLFLLLCAHGAKHYWPDLVLVCDLAELIRSHPQMDWRRMVWRARASNALRLLRVGILLGYSLLDADIPADLIAEARSDRTAAALSRDICDNFFVDKVERGISEGGWIIREIRFRERWQDKLTYVWNHVNDWTPNERDRNAIHLSDPLSFLYRVVRPVRLAWQYGIGMAKEIVKR